MPFAVEIDVNRAVWKVCLPLRKVIVSGGPEFFESHLCDPLVSKGHGVNCVDNYLSGCKENITHLLDAPNFEAMHYGVTFSLYVEVDEICNLDCPASPHHYQAHPVQTINGSVHDSINYLGPDKRCKAKVLLASSSELSEDPLRDPSTRASTATSPSGGPRACYDEGNRCAETIFYDYHSQHGVASKVVRTFSFCSVGDLIEGIVVVIAIGPRMTGPIYVGNPLEVTIMELEIRASTGCNTEIERPASKTQAGDARTFL